MLLNYLAVMAGGALGVGGRMLISVWMGDTSFPSATLLVNVLGCVLIGLFVGLTGNNGPWILSPLLRQVVVIGVLGGFTTFSSFSMQTIILLTDGQWLFAFANIFLTLTLCLFGTWGGMITAGLWQVR